MKWLIEDIKCDISENGKHAGLVPGSVVSSIKYKLNDESKWLHCMDFQGLSFFHSDKNLHDVLLNDYTSEEDTKLVERYHIESFFNIDLNIFSDVMDLDDYSEAIEIINADEKIKSDKNPALILMQYLMILTRCPLDNTEACISEGYGKYIDEIDLKKVCQLLD